MGALLGAISYCLCFLVEMVLVVITSSVLFGKIQPANFNYPLLQTITEENNLACLRYIRKIPFEGNGRINSIHVPPSPFTALGTLTEYCADR